MSEIDRGELIEEEETKVEAVDMFEDLVTEMFEGMAGDGVSALDIKRFYCEDRASLKEEWGPEKFQTVHQFVDEHMSEIEDVMVERIEDGRIKSGLTIAPTGRHHRCHACGGFLPENWLYEYCSECMSDVEVET